MVYASAAEEERMLSYSPKQPMSSTTTSASSSQAPAPPASAIVTAEQPQPNSHLSATTSRLSSYAAQTWHERRPWSEFYSTRALSRPAFADLSDRCAANLHLYRANYQIIAAGWLCLVLLGSVHSLLLAILGFLAIEKWLSRMGPDVQHKHKVVALVVGLTIIWATGIGAYVVQSLFLSSVSIGLHAVFHEPDSVETEIATV